MRIFQPSPTRSWEMQFKEKHSLSLSAEPVCLVVCEEGRALELSSEVSGPAPNQLAKKAPLPLGLNPGYPLTQVLASLAGRPNPQPSGLCPLLRC